MQRQNQKLYAFEVTFFSRNFMHLTGVKPTHTQSNLKNSKSFYNKCISSKLSKNDFEFSKDGTTHLKLNVLSSVISKNLNAKMVGSYDGQRLHLHTEKIAGNHHACLGFVKSKADYIPNTLIQDNIKNLTGNKFYQIVATFRKPYTEQTYREITYKSNNFDFKTHELPQEYAYLKKYFFADFSEK